MRDLFFFCSTSSWGTIKIKACGKCLARVGPDRSEATKLSTHLLCLWNTSKLCVWFTQEVFTTYHWYVIMKTFCLTIFQSWFSHRLRSICGWWRERSTRQISRLKSVCDLFESILLMDYLGMHFHRNRIH